MTIHDPGDLFGAAISALCVLGASGVLGCLWNSRLPPPRGVHYALVGALAAALAVVALVISYWANVTWS